MTDSVLTIAIPTYNRAALLDTCLAAIVAQLADVPGQVELLLSNNASTDATVSIVEKYRVLVPGLRYHQNETNIGPDGNIAKCFELAQTDYVWIFSDDDILLPNTLAPIVALLQSRELGLLHLTPTWYNHDIADATIPKEEFASKIYTDPLIFCEEVNYWVTFITSNIIHKSLVAGLSTVYQFKDTNLIQLGWTLPVIFRARANGKVFSHVILGRATEGVDYRFFKVFSRNINKVLQQLVAENFLPVAVRDIINQKLITNFFPQYLTPDKRSFNNEKPFATLFSVFKSYPGFYTTLLPLFIKRFYAVPVGRLTGGTRRLVLRTYERIAASSAYQQGQVTLRSLRKVGVNATLPIRHEFMNPHRISIGRRFFAQSILRISAWENYAGATFDAQVVIGDDVQLGYDCTINCINRVEIGNQVLISNRVCITDHAPDDQDVARMLPPAQRHLISKGPVIIGERVLIEEDVRIHGGVRIGEGAVIKAGAIIWTDVMAEAIVPASQEQLA